MDVKATGIGRRALRTVVLTMVAGALPVVAATDAYAATSVTLTASAVVARPGESVQLVATAATTTQEDAYVWIVDETTGTYFNTSCISTCTVSDSHDPVGTLYESHVYYAFAYGCGPSSCVEYAESTRVVVTWTSGDPGVVDTSTAGAYSASCLANGGETVADNTVEGVHTFVAVDNQSPNEVDVCFRAESGGTGVGGMIAITPAAPSVTPPGVSNVTLPGLGVPSTDGNAQACTTTTSPANQVPGTHPIATGTVVSVSYLLDAYLNDTQAWVCLRVGTAVDTRIVVPISVPGTPGATLYPGSVSVGYVVTFYPDAA